MIRNVVAALLSICILSCVSLDDDNTGSSMGGTPTPTTGEEGTPNTDFIANVEDVGTERIKEDLYNFQVTIRSSDRGCDRYADWWEVITPEGSLIYRRILAHSHVDEQPFARIGGPIEVKATDTVIIRAHMFPLGYGKKAMLGSVEGGFTSFDVSSSFAKELATQEPLPRTCDF